jgi:hypothetical protein
MMGLLDGLPLRGWNGLLDAPVNLAPPQRHAPFFGPPVEHAYSEPTPQYLRDANPYRPTAMSWPSPEATAPLLVPQIGQPKGLPNWAQAPTGDPFAGFSDGVSEATNNQPAYFAGVAQQRPTAQNLTARALRMRGVPEADIAAAIGNPDLMKQLVYQNYGPGSAVAPTKIGLAPQGSSASSGPFGYSGQGVNPEANRSDGDRASRDALAWGQFTPSDPIGYGGPLGFHAPSQTQPSISGVPTNSVMAQPESPKPPLEDTPIHLAQVFAFPPLSFFARPPVYVPRQLTPLEDLPSGSANGPRAGMDFLRNEGKPKTPEEYPPCTYCGEKTGPGNFHRDHIIPRARGGDGSDTNRAPACPSCNLGKGARTPEEWYNAMKNNGA